MTRFLVTGGAGFIGSHLCAALVDRGDAVRVLDDLSTGHLENLPPGVDFRRGDVCDGEAVRAALDGVDGCFHLAAIASVERGVKEWAVSHRANLSGTVTLLDAIARGGRRVPFVYASSAAIYGTPAETPIRETAAPHPLSAYGVDKLGSEMHARIGTTTHGVPTVGMRFFNVYGPRQDPRSPYSGVISIFCDRLARGEGIELHGGGEQTRDFVYVGDVVQALLRAMAAPPPDAPVYNVCTGRATSIRHLAEVIAGLCGRPLAATPRPTRPGDIRESVGSPAALADAFGFTPSTRLEDGLGQVLAWLRGEASPRPASAQDEADGLVDQDPQTHGQREDQARRLDPVKSGGLDARA